MNMTEHAPGSPRRRITVALASLAVMGAAVGIFALLVATKKEAPQSERVQLGQLVEVVEVSRGPRKVTVEANGRALAAREIVVQPEVSGRVTWHAPHLAPGGRFKKGDAMFKLDPRDYRIALSARRADVSRAEVALRVERGTQKVAQKEWETFGGDSAVAQEDRDLALREPQLRAAEVALDAAKSTLEKAALDLERTVVKAPFDGVVVSASIGVGMVVGPQSQLGRFAATDEFWVTVAVPASVITRLDFPAGERLGSAVTIRYRAGDSRGEIRGELLRLLPDLDPQGSMARLIARIPAPLDQSPPLLLGTYVDVSVESEPLADVAEIPRAALQEGNVVFVMTKDETLELRPVEIAWELPKTLLVSKGLASGERVVTTQIGTPIPGMKLRVAAKAEPRKKLSQNARTP
jgi:RND family efflux transporter MFP subunit